MNMRDEKYCYCEYNTIVTTNSAILVNLIILFLNYQSISHASYVILYTFSLSFPLSSISLSFSFLFKKVQHITIIIHLFFHLIISLLLYLWTTLTPILTSLKQTTPNNTNQKILITELIIFFNLIKKFSMINSQEKLSMVPWNNNPGPSTKL